MDIIVPDIAYQLKQAKSDKIGLKVISIIECCEMIEHANLKKIVFLQSIFLLYWIAVRLCLVKYDMHDIFVGDV